MRCAQGECAASFSVIVQKAVRPILPLDNRIGQNSGSPPSHVSTLPLSLLTVFLCNPPPLTRFQSCSRPSIPFLGLFLGTFQNWFILSIVLNPVLVFVSRSASHKPQPPIRSTLSKTYLSNHIHSQERFLLLPRPYPPLLPTENLSRLLEEKCGLFPLSFAIGLC